MNDPATLNAIDYIVFFVYMALTVALGFAVSRGARSKPQDYFLGEKKLPWYVIGTSMVSSDISSETFIANVGIAYVYGIVAGTTGWNAWIIYTIFLFVFLPYYVRTGLYTMPEFLERRYNATCRYLYAFSLVVGYIATLLAGSLYAGGLAIDSMFHVQMTGNHNTNIVLGIIFFAVVTGTYTIYGGLKSSAWTDFLQMMVMLVAGILLPVLALHKTGGLFTLAREYPQKFQMFLPATNKQFPWTGVVTGFLTVGLWYTCASQHIVQRVLAAKDEWHARMGVVSAGFLRILTPLFFVIPGIAAYKLFPQLEAAHQQDQAYLLLVQTLIPTGLKGLILAGMAAALMSTLSTVLNSTSTLLTIDIYKKLLRPNAGDREQVVFGMATGVVALMISVFIAFWYMKSPEALFRLVQRIFFWIAPPFSVVFLLGLLWRRATAPAAVAAIFSGFIFRMVVEWIIWPRLTALRAYQAAYQHGALITWLFCIVVMVIVSLMTTAPNTEHTKGIIWNRSYLHLPPEQRKRYRGWKNYVFWWLLFVAIVLGIYGYFLWFSLSRP
ncbi:MAG TPA: sodium/solute symporter [Lacipirellulaceae bacterium]|nr:sodium/solute symporter [Lacipirellulaceae bacterium]